VKAIICASAISRCWNWASMIRPHRKFRFPRVGSAVARQRCAMRCLFVASSFCMVLLMTASLARAAECNIEREALHTALQQAYSCAHAYRVFKACSSGASGDVALGTIVQKKCESRFPAKLGAAASATYKRKLTGCDHKYAKQSGSMYRSFEAFCRAGLARDYADRYSRRKLRRHSHIPT
jgi:hypothetical protein